MFIILPVASDRILTWMQLEFHIKQTLQRSPGENWTDLEGEIQRPVLAVTERRRIYEAGRTQGT